jgi:hypothetical protein
MFHGIRLATFAQLDSWLELARCRNCPATAAAIEAEYNRRSAITVHVPNMKDSDHARAA